MSAAGSSRRPIASAPGARRPSGASWSSSSAPTRATHGKALRVSRYLTEQPHVRFSVWNADGVAEAAVSLEEEEAERLAGFLAAPAPARLGAVERLLSLLPRG